MMLNRRHVYSPRPELGTVRRREERHWRRWREEYESDREREEETP